MIIYICFLLLIVFGIFHYDRASSRNRGNLLYCILCVAMILPIAFIGEMGNDYLRYIVEYDRLPELDDLVFSYLEIGGRAQPFWLYFNGFTKLFGDDYSIFMLFHSSFVNIIIFWFVARNTRYKFTTILLYFLSLNYFYFNIEILRESLALCIFLISFKYLVTKKYIRYYVLAVVAFLFHASAIFTFLMPLVFKMFEIKNKYVLYGIFIVMVLLVWNAGMFIGQLNAISYFAGVIDQFDFYNEIDRNLNTLILSALISSVPIVLFIKSCTLPKDSWTYKTAYFMLLLTLCGPGIVGLARLQNYIIIPYYVFIADTCFGLKGKSSRIRNVVLAFLIMAVMEIYHYTRENVHDEGHQYYEMYFPYRSKYDKV